MGANLAQLRSLTTSELKIDPNNKIWSVSVKDQAINQAYIQAQKDCIRSSAGEASGTLAITTGTQEYALPTDLLMYTYVGIGGRSLDLSSKSESFALQGATGDPSRYYTYGGNIGFLPMPSQGFNVDYLYRKILPTLTLDSDTSLLETAYDRAISLYAKYILLAQIPSKEGDAMKAYNEYGVSMASANSLYVVQSAGAFKLGTLRSRR